MEAISLGPHVAQAAIQTSGERGLRRTWDLAGPSESAPPPGGPLRIGEPGHQTVQERGRLAGSRDRAGCWGNQIRGLRADRGVLQEEVAKVGLRHRPGSDQSCRPGLCGPVGQVGYGSYSQRNTLAGFSSLASPFRHSATSPSLERCPRLVSCFPSKFQGE